MEFMGWWGYYPNYMATSNVARSLKEPTALDWCSMSSLQLTCYSISAADAASTQVQAYILVYAGYSGPLYIIEYNNSPFSLFVSIQECNLHLSDRQQYL